MRTIPFISHISLGKLRFIGSFIDRDRLTPEFFLSCSGCLSEVAGMPGTATRLIRLRVRDVDATGKAANVTANGLAVTH
jgi:hypothetical protein